MSNVSMSLVGMLYNLQLIKYAGDDGIAAYGVMMYVSMIFSAVFIGYSIGSAPVISYHHGARNYGELHGLLRRSLVLISASAVVMFAAAEWLAAPLARIFVSYSAPLLDMTVHGFRIFSLAFLFMGFAIFGSSFFTALNDGLTSAPHLVSAHAGVSGWRSAASATRAGAGRDMVLRRRGGAHGGRILRHIPHFKEEKYHY